MSYRLSWNVETPEFVDIRNVANSQLSLQHRFLKRRRNSNTWFKRVYRCLYLLLIETKSNVVTQGILFVFLEQLGVCLKEKTVFQSRLMSLLQEKKEFVPVPVPATCLPQFYLNKIL